MHLFALRMGRRNERRTARNSRRFVFALVTFLALWLAASSAAAQATLLDGFGGAVGFGVDELDDADDVFAGPINLGALFPSGIQYGPGDWLNQVWINDNGNFTFNNNLVQWYPSPAPVTTIGAFPMIAPWWVDVDLRAASPGPDDTIYYHQDLVGGRLIATWYEVGYYNSNPSLRNSFQGIITNRDDINAGDFDVEYRYNLCEFTLGTASGGVHGSMGMDSGNGTDYWDHPDSMTPAIIDLCTTSNVGDVGVWRFSIRNGSHCPDADFDTICDGEDNCPADWNPPQTDTDGDLIGDVCDADDDNDGVLDAADSDPLDPTLCQDLDADGCDDCAVGTDGFGPLPDFDPADDGADTDGDGICDLTDLCLGDNSTGDTDGDGICNDTDTDDDNDGVIDTADSAPLDPTLCQDLDGDTCDDCAVGTDGFGPLPDFDPFDDGLDTDGDGICDLTDLCDGDDSTGDTDGDGICNDTDTDDDNDGVLDTADSDPLDPTLCQDLDGDTCDDCAVGTDGFGPLSDFDPLDDGLDTDGDGVCDLTDLCDGDDSTGDTDGDGICNDTDTDDDNDGVLDAADSDPLDPTLCQDLDADGCDDCSVGIDGFGPLPDFDPADDGPDTDGDGICDLTDLCDGDNSTGDTDGDGICNDTDTDDDNDGVLDTADSDPLDPTLCQDLDADGCDDCSVGTDGFGPLSDFDPANDGTDTDGDGVCDLTDICAGDNSTGDTDGDGICNDMDTDDDNDGVLDTGDVDPLDPYQCQDLDGDTCDDCSVGTDGFGPLSDFDPADDGTDSDGDGICDLTDLCDGDDSTGDTDGDGICDDLEILIGTDPNDADSDDDGVIDGDEVDYDVDTDGDGLINALDPDSDDDGLYDGTEMGITTADLDPDTDVSAGHFVPDADPTTTTSMVDADTDSGGVPDGAEDWNLNGAIDAGETDPNDASDDVASVDTDGDGLSDELELTIGTDPYNADSDNDGVLDGDEHNFADDTDGDGLINAMDPDSDGDGLFDGTEMGITTADLGPDTDVTAGFFVPDADPSTTTSMVNPDTDYGGVPDGVEDWNLDGAIDAGETDPDDPTDDVAPTDTDGDGIPDDYDNCPDDYNPGQEDSDSDIVGDVCDNCPDDYNPGQEDSDSDDIGDVCDDDEDAGVDSGPDTDTDVDTDTDIDIDTDVDTDTDIDTDSDTDTQTDTDVKIYGATGSGALVSCNLNGAGADGRDTGLLLTLMNLGI